MIETQRLRARLDEAFSDSELFDTDCTSDDVTKWIDTICDSRIHDRKLNDLVFSMIPASVVAKLLHTLLTELEETRKPSEETKST